MIRLNAMRTAISAKIKGEFMRLLLIFLNKIECLDDLMSAFLEIGVTGATVCDSVGMGHIITHDIPIFAGLKNAFAGSSPSNKIIFIVTDVSMIETISRVVQEIVGSFEEKGTSKIVTIPLEDLYGF